MMDGNSESNADIVPIHPGEILLEQFLDPAGVDRQRLAEEIGLPVKRIEEIIVGERSICADTALRLARFLSTAPELWLHLQNQYDLERVGEEIHLELQIIEPLASPQNRDPVF